MLTDLRALRRYKKLTQRELSKLANVSKSTISNIEKGRKVPGLDTIYKLAKGLSVQPLELCELLLAGENFLT